MRNFLKFMETNQPLVLLLAVGAILVAQPWVASAALHVEQEYKLNEWDWASSHATRYLQTNKVVTANGYTHVTWLSSDNDVKIKTYNHSTSSWGVTTDVGTAYDNHGGPALAVDSDGYLHIFYGPHGDRAFDYKVSSSPNSSTSWGSSTSVGSTATYPSVVIDSNDKIHLTYRRSSGTSDDTLVYQSKADGGSWSGITTLVSSPSDYGNFHHSMAIDNDDDLHVTYDIWNMDVNKATRVGHLQSTNNGSTWTLKGGASANLPVEVSDTPLGTYFFRHDDAKSFNIKNCAVDSTDDLWLVLEEWGGEDPTTLRVWQLDGTTWNNYYVSSVVPTGITNPTGDLVISFDSNDNMYLAGTFGGDLGVLKGTAAQLASATDFEYLNIHDDEVGFDPLGINIERSCGPDDIGIPWILYTEGDDLYRDVYAVELGLPEPSTIASLIIGLSCIFGRYSVRRSRKAS